MTTGPRRTPPSSHKRTCPNKFDTGVADPRRMKRGGLVGDTGWGPVVVGPLERAEEFDRGTPVWVRGESAAQLREALNIR